jgi:hypothetical protein
VGQKTNNKEKEMTEADLRQIVEGVLLENFLDLDAGDDAALDISKRKDDLIVELLVLDKDDDEAEEPTIVDSRFRVRIVIEKI